MEQKSDGEINEVEVTLFNFENTIGALIEDPFIAGNNKNNSAMAVVNGEYVNGIDPRSINAVPGDLGDPHATDLSNVSNLLLIFYNLYEIFKGQGLMFITLVLLL